MLIRPIPSGFQVIGLKSIELIQKITTLLERLYRIQRYLRTLKN